MPFSRYQTSVSEEERRQLCNAVEKLLRQSSEGDKGVWEAFIRDTIHLPLCYLDGLRKVLDQGRWKAKSDPVGFIRKTVQTAAFASMGLPDERKNRTKIHVGRAIDEDQRRPQTLEESLRFDQPKRRPNAYAGNIADLKLPTLLQIDEEGRSDWRGLHDSAIDYFTYKYDQDVEESPPWPKHCA